jgi:4-hydroxybenzoate polyprenyltransferase
MPRSFDPPVRPASGAPAEVIRSSASASRPTPVSDRASLPLNLLISLRPRQWTKNLLVFAGLIFGQKLLERGALERATAAFAIFCVLSGVIYLINDLRDREADRLHPDKARRPIASGALPPSAAAISAVVLGSGGLLAAFALDLEFGLVALAYVALLGVYSAGLKHIVILDVLTIAVGFVFRALAGALVIDVPFSHWLLLLTLLGAMFLALSKRRAELVSLSDDAPGHRRILAEYSPYLLDQMVGVVTASTLLAYAFYTISPETVTKFGTDHLLYTVPFLLYGIFRYLYLVHRREGGANPSELRVTERPLLACVALWVLAVVLIVYGPLR